MPKSIYKFKNKIKSGVFDVADGRNRVLVGVNKKIVELSLDVWNEKFAETIDKFEKDENGNDLEKDTNMEVSPYLIYDSDERINTFELLDNANMLLVRLDESLELYQLDDESRKYEQYLGMVSL